MALDLTKRSETGRPLFNSEVDQNWTDIENEVAGKVRWRGEYEDGQTYEVNDMARDGLYTGVANTQTTDPIQPQGVGNEGYISDIAANVTPPLSLVGQTPINEEVLITGNTYDFTFTSEISLVRFRVPDITGTFTYSVWQILNIDSSDPEVTQLIAPFTPTTTNWIFKSIPTRLQLPGSQYSLALITTPSSSSNVFSSDWNVVNSNGNPSSGQANFQNNETEIRIHNEDDGGTDQSSNLLSVEVGGTLDFGGISWQITSVGASGSHVRFGVTPAQGRPAGGLYTLNFAWAFPAALPYEQDTNYYNANDNIRGFIGQSFPTLTTTQQGYGVDIFVSETIMSPDWDIAAVSGGVGGVTTNLFEVIQLSCSDLTSDLAVGTKQAYFRLGRAFTVNEVRASVIGAPTGSGIVVDINENATSILSTKITIDATEKTSTTAAVPPVISDASLNDDSEITIDIDAVGSTAAGVGLIVTLIGNYV